MKILIVEDHKELASNITDYLRKEDYVCEVASTKEEADEKIDFFEYDCILLDLMLPDGSGLEVLREIKHKKLAAGIIIISAKDSLDHKLEGLEEGADDYMTKPFALPELHARIKAVSRRKTLEVDHALVFNEIKIDLESKECLIAGKPVNLTRKELNLLIFLSVTKTECFPSRPLRVTSGEIILTA